MTAEIITIGDELLIGQVIDTNSAWIAQSLNEIGIKVFQITSVSDSKRHIIKALEDASKRTRLILITGGLGPTSDDITKPTLCEYFNTRLVSHEETLEHIKTMLLQRGVKAFELNYRQADVPECCTVIKNEVGTAPCMWFEKDNVVYVSMPGVPFEMRHIMENGVIPKIIEYFQPPAIVHKNALTFGIPESMLSEQISDWESQLPTEIKLAYLPSPEGIKLRLSIAGNDKNLLHELVEKHALLLHKYIPDAIVSLNGENLQQTIGSLLKTMKKTVSSAESCTGGHIAKMITENAGCSVYYRGSVVAYANDVKENVLGVNKTDILNYGAVSEQVVRQMAQGVQKIMGTHYAIATSGVAGPDGGSIEKPVGTVWIAVASPEKVISRKYNFGKLRDVNIRRAANTALNMLRILLMEDKERLDNSSEQIK